MKGRGPSGRGPGGDRARAFADDVEVRLILAAVCLHGSMLSASQHLGVSGPTIRRLIRSAEDRAGVRLVQATASGTKLTSHGLRTIGLQDSVHA